MLDLTCIAMAWRLLLQFHNYGYLPQGDKFRSCFIHVWPLAVSSTGAWTVPLTAASLHLQSPVHTFLHTQCISSLRDCDASGSVCIYTITCISIFSDVNALQILTLRSMTLYDVKFPFSDILAGKTSIYTTF